MLARLGGLLLLMACALPARTLEIHNAHGDVAVVVTERPKVLIEGGGASRKATPDDVDVVERPGRTVLTVRPTDGKPLDFVIEAPLGLALEVETGDGDISIEGLVHRARLRTETGAIRLSAAWGGTRMTLDADVKPAEVDLPNGRKFVESAVEISGGRTLWRLRDNLPERTVVYGDYRIRAKRPERVVLEEYDAPKTFPLKFPSEAPQILEAILRGEAPSADSPPAKPPVQALSAEGAEGALFRSDVRMVNLVLAVNDASGRPVGDLETSDFRVIENGVEQQVAFAGSDDVPVNLAILLDLSGSAKLDRRHMLAAAEGFVGIAKPQDRVAIYALSDAMFHVVSTLTNDRQALLRRIGQLPEISGATPLYDLIVLAYDEELRRRSGERNALIVVSDGIDNQVSDQESPSSVKFKRLVKAAEEFNALIYPVFLRSGERFGRNWSHKARRNMEKLATASGGRLFPAASIEDLNPVFPQIEAELRSVYTVAYYPNDQEFDGSWRRVDVEVGRPELEVRARRGYYAQ